MLTIMIIVYNVLLQRTHCLAGVSFVPPDSISQNKINFEKPFFRFSDESLSGIVMLI